MFTFCSRGLWFRPPTAQYTDDFVCLLRQIRSTDSGSCSVAWHTHFLPIMLIAVVLANRDRYHSFFFLCFVPWWINGLSNYLSFINPNCNISLLVWLFTERIICLFDWPNIWTPLAPEYFRFLLYYNDSWFWFQDAGSWLYTTCVFNSSFSVVNLPSNSMFSPLYTGSLAQVLQKEARG